MRFARRLLLVAVVAWSFGAAPASAQGVERITSYDVVITINDDGTLAIHETIVYDFASTSERHGIFRDIPTTLRYDDTYDRIYPIEVVDVSGSPGTPVGYEVESISGGQTRIKIGDADTTITGIHTYEISYVVAGAMNGFEDHDELYWNAIGTDWAVEIEHATVTVGAPAPIERQLCFAGPLGSTTECDRTRVTADRARFSDASLGSFEGMTVVVAIPAGAVPAPSPVLRERWSFGRAFEASRATVPPSIALLGVLFGGLGFLWWRTGRDRRWRGGQVDQVMGNAGGEEQTVPLFEGGASAPVEFAPPDDMRPGQMGTLIDERANTLDVTATIVDLAVRGFLLIQEIPKEGWFGKPDWTLIRLEGDDEVLFTYERRLLNGLFRDGTEITVSDLRTTFVSRLKSVEESMYVDVVKRGWFNVRPDKARLTWARRGMLLLAGGVVLTVVLARSTHWGLLGLPVVLAGVVLLLGGNRLMPARTAEGTAALRRIRGFRTVIETAETHVSRWAEEEGVFTRFLPYAVVFGCTDGWARAFEGLGTEPDASWYISPHPFVYARFADSIDGFAVTTGGTISSTPAGSGSSGFSGGGFSGGGGGGGGGGSW